MNNAAAVLDQNGIAITAGDITVLTTMLKTVNISLPLLSISLMVLEFRLTHALTRHQKNAPASLSVVIPTRTSGNMFQTTEAKRFTAQRMVTLCKSHNREITLLIRR